MIKLRPSTERGGADHGWLKTQHSFSFADYYDPRHMGYRSLRVINEDHIGGGGGFPPHRHRDMEIITYVISGALEHQDSLGNGSEIQSGDVQYMSAGTGVTHSEYNHSSTTSVHLLQIWIMTNQPNAVPRYDQHTITREKKLNQLALVVSKSEDDGSLSIRQDALIFASVLEASKKLEYSPANNRGVWLQLISGELEVAGVAMQAGDGLEIENEAKIQIHALRASEFLLFDLA